MNIIEQYLQDLFDELNRRTSICKYWQHPEIVAAVKDECDRLGIMFERVAQ